MPERHVAHDPIEAADWALNRTSTLYRNHAIQHTIIEWNRGNDGSESAAWLVGHLAEKDRLQLYEKTAVREITETLARQDLRTAREFINSLDSLEGQQAGISVLIDHWANEDLEKADRWLEDLVSQAGSFASDGTYDEAYRVMAFRIVDHDVEAAQRWINRISDDSEYNSVLDKLRSKLAHSQ